MKIDPEKHFVPTQENVARLLTNYGLTLQDFQDTTSGIENTTLVVDCSEGKYVLRVYRQDKKTDEHVLQEVEFLRFLFSKNIKVPRIIANIAGTFLTKMTSSDLHWQAILMEFVPGHHAPKYTTALLNDIADTQARIHTVSAAFDNSYRGRELHELDEQPFIKHTDRLKLPDPRLADFLDRARTYQVPLDKNLPSGLCHLDYDKDNILVDKNGDIAAVLDFDDLALAPYAVCLANTLWEITDCTDKPAARHYLKRYEQTRFLSPAEKSVIPPAMLYRHYEVYATWISLGRVTSKQEVNHCLAIEKALQDT